MNENILNNFLKNRPSYLAYEDELKLIDIMMKLPMDWLIKNEAEFIEALNTLDVSHTSGMGFLYEEESDDVIFENFCNWLKEVSRWQIQRQSPNSKEYQIFRSLISIVFQMIVQSLR